MIPSVLIPHSMFDGLLQRQMDKSKRYELTCYLTKDGVVVAAVDLGWVEKKIDHIGTNAENRIRHD